MPVPGTIHSHNCSDSMRGTPGAWCAMQCKADNPDRDFSADPADEAEILRRLLQNSEVADLLDEAIRQRVGRAIARAAFDPTKAGW